MRTYKEEYKYWLESPVVDDETKRELQAISGDENEIEGRFKAMMTFGTGGLRGIMKAGIAMMNVYTVRLATQGLANVIKSKGGDGVVIAHDSRNNSTLFSQEAARVLVGNGIKVYLFDDIRSTPELSFAVRETGSMAGINVTASHNAKEYNGYKAYGSDGCQMPPEDADSVSAEIDKIDIFEDVKVADFDQAVSEGKIEIIGDEMDQKYLENILEQSVGEKYVKAAGDIKIVYTPFHGAGYKLVPEILNRIGIKNIIPVEEQMIPDGNFPTVKSPNPENTEGFALAIEYAKKHDADLIIGTDPDSDRCGSVVKNNGEYIVLSGNQMACLMLDYLINVKREQGTLASNAAVCKSIVSTLMADKICAENNIKMFRVLTGFKFIGEKMTEFEKSKEYKFLFGFEESIGFLAGTYARDKDAILASMLMAEMACYYKTKGMTVYEGLQSLYEKYGYFCEKTESIWFEGYDAQEKMANVLSQLRKNPPKKINSEVANTIDYLDDIPGYTKSNVLCYELADGCTVFVRPSGTEPRVKVYLLAQGASQGEAKARIDAMLKAIISELKSE